jgi:tetratricopeptide (TPR) repeat protein
MNERTHTSRPKLGLADDLQLSNSDSFRLFTEGVVALDSYERSGAPGSLETAGARLTQCVQKYPADVLPRLYLGIAKSFLGDMNQQEAIRFLQSVESSGVESLRLPAKYNLATAYIEEYSSESMRRAEMLLTDLQKDLEPEKASQAELYFQSWAVLLYVKIHRHLWDYRNCQKPEELAERLPLIEELGQELDRFYSDFESAGGHRIAGSDDIMAEYWNAKATYEESLAGLYRPDPEKSRQHATKAVHAFQEALQIRHNWSAPKANLGRITWELLGNLEEAENIFRDITQGFEDVEYAYYNLGKIFGLRGQYDIAADYYAKAPTIGNPTQPLRRYAMQQHALTLQRQFRFAEAQKIWVQVHAEYPDDEQAAKAVAEFQSQTPEEKNPD